VSGNEERHTGDASGLVKIGVMTVGSHADEPSLDFTF
jgi:hypothetical protein